MEQTEKHNAVGRRKEAIARVSLVPGKGSITVNNVSYDKYFVKETDRIIIKHPFTATNTVNKFDCFANIRGGGLSGQAEALRLGIARVLIAFDSSLRGALRKQGFVTRDPRMKERKKYGQKGARKRFQWTKR